MAKKKSKKKVNGKVGGKADVHINEDGGKNKSLLGQNVIFTPEVIDDIHIKAQLVKKSFLNESASGQASHRWTPGARHSPTTLMCRWPPCQFPASGYKI